MIILNPISRNKIISAWLKSELYRKRSELSVDDIRIIENPNLEDDTENQNRENLLLHTYGRSAILDKLPNDIEWFEIEIEDQDMDKIFILPVLDWFMDTGRTFQLKNIPSNLSANRGHRLNNYPQMPTTHHQKIQEMVALPEEVYGDIVMIASTNEGPFTIIDGTHRSSVLQTKGQLPSTKGFLGINNDLSQCIWSIERASMTSDFQELNQLADQGVIW